MRWESNALDVRRESCGVCWRVAKACQDRQAAEEEEHAEYDVSDRQDLGKNSHVGKCKMYIEVTLSRPRRV
jgi:hypothetical protein